MKNLKIKIVCIILLLMNTGYSNNISDSNKSNLSYIKNEIIKRISELEKLSNKKKKIVEKNDYITKVEKLNEILSTVQLMEKDTVNSFVINLRESDTGYHFVWKNNKNQIVIDASDLSFVVHEISHIMQNLISYKGFDVQLQFIIKDKTLYLANPGRTLKEQMINEIEAYKYGASFSDKNLLTEIDYNYLLNIRNDDGKQVYAAFLKIKE